MIGALIYDLVHSIIQIYPLRGAQGKTLPLATYQILMNDPTNHIYDSANNRKVSVQINVVGPVYGDLQTTARNIINAMDRYYGTAGGESVKDIRHTGGPDDLFQEEAETFGVYLTFDIWVKQNIVIT
jgi:hypothetical protein